MTISTWPEAERPRERLLNQGVESLSDAELLAVLLRNGARGVTAVEMARLLLQQFGGVRGLLSMPQRQLMSVKGLGPAKCAQLLAALELGRRVQLEELQNKPLFDSSEATRRYLNLTLSRRPRECFACLFLDSQHRLLACEILFEGTIDAAAVYPREVVRRALELGAQALILAHNHPSGVAEPSQSDRRLTEKLITALALVDIRVLDHIIVAGPECLSFAERGLLP